MTGIRLRYGAAAAALAVGGGLALWTATPAQATDGTRLELPAYGDLVVDQGRGQVFVSGGPSSNGVVVTDRWGNVVKTITGQHGATGMVLSADGHRLYVGLAAGDAISVINTRTLKEVERHPTGAQTCPTHLTRTEAVIWFGHGCDNTWSGGIGKLEFPPTEPTTPPSASPSTSTPPRPSPRPLTTPNPSPSVSGSPSATASQTPAPPKPTVTLNAQGSVRFQRAPLLTAHDDKAGPLVAGQPQLSLSTVYVYNITTKAELTTRTSGTAAGSNLHDIALDNYAETLFTGAGSRNAAPAYSTADLSGRGSYHTGYYPLAVAPSPDGFHLAVGVRSTGDDVYVYEIGGVVPERRLDVTADVLAPRGLTWSPDSRTLYVVTQPPAGGPPTLRVVHDPTA